MSLLTEVLIIGGVAMDLVGAVGTQAQLLAEKRVGFFILTAGLSLYLAGLVLKTTEGVGVMAAVAVGVVALGLASAALWVRIRGRRIRGQIQGARRAEGDGDLPEQ